MVTATMSDMYWEMVDDEGRVSIILTKISWKVVFSLMNIRFNKGMIQEYWRCRRFLLGTIKAIPAAL